MTGTELAQKKSPLDGIEVDKGAILKHLGLDANDPAAQALVLACQRYGLDPILKHAVLIQGRMYVTRDGLLHVAHESKKLNGIVVVDEGEDATHFRAKVAVYRKDMEHPFTYVGRYPKSGGNKNYGPEMAIKCAEVMALRRAFDVSLASKEEMWDQEIEDSPGVGQSAVTGSAAGGTAGDPVRSNDRGAGGLAGPPDPDLPLAGDRPCPDCGYEVEALSSSNPKAPKWKCSNDTCTGHHNKQKDDYEPWVSWHENPWKPGGEVEQLIKSSSSETGAKSSGEDDRAATGSPAYAPSADASAAPSQASIEGGGDQAATAEADTNGTAPSDRQEPSPPSIAPSALDGQHLLALIDNAIKAKLIRVSDVIRAASPIVLGMEGVKPPTKAADFADMPVEVLAAVVDKLKLEERVPA